MTEFTAAKEARDEINARLTAASEKMNHYPRGTIGLTPDEIKATPEWRANRTECDAIFQELRRFNQKFVKRFAKEIRAERRNRTAP